MTVPPREPEDVLGSAPLNGTSDEALDAIGHACGKVDDVALLALQFYASRYDRKALLNRA